MDIDSNLIAKHHNLVLIFFLDSELFVQSYVKNLSGFSQEV